MTLVVPTHILTANIQDNTIKYKWDDWGWEKAEEPFDKEFAAILGKISQRAILAFMCGTAEWIIERFATLADITAPNDYIEAAWVMLNDLRYRNQSWQEYAAKGWDGPIKKPIWIALLRVEVAMEQLAWEGTDPAKRATFISNLASYVMTDKEPYQRWRELTIERFISLYPRDLKDKLGDIVPRQALDPESDFDVEKTEILINEFLGGLNYHTNFFLKSPEEMQEVDTDEDEGEPFEGLPYKFDIEADRRSRSSFSG